MVSCLISAFQTAVSCSQALFLFLQSIGKIRAGSISSGSGISVRSKQFSYSGGFIFGDNATVPELKCLHQTCVQFA